MLLVMYDEASPNCHLSGLNPHIDLEGFPACIMTEGFCFRCENSLCSVLSFGFGGTNACAMSWGQNLMTSRCFANKDTYNIAIQKLSEAPAQEVTINGEDWEDWFMDGPEKDAKPFDKWEFEIDEDGEVTYEKIDPFEKDLGKEYFLTGTMNDWDYEAFTPDLLC